jgi:hypothetical protein
MTMIDHFKEAAAAMRSRVGFDGTMLKFSKEAGWLAGKDGESMNDVELLALVNDIMRGWVLWIDKKPTDYYVGHIRTGYEPPRRDQLGHDDKRRWRNMKDDPWQFTHFLPLLGLENDNTLFIYSTTSQGGRDCLANLLDAYVGNKETHPEDVNKLPLVTLARDHYTHASYGKVAIPLLDVNEWNRAARRPEADHAASGVEHAIDRQHHRHQQADRAYRGGLGKPR